MHNLKHTPSALAHFPNLFTLALVWSEFQLNRKIKQASLTKYESHLNRYLGDWLDRPVRCISRKDVEQRHELIAREHSPQLANTVARILRLLFNFAADHYGSFDNPASCLEPLKKKYAEKRKRTITKTPKEKKPLPECMQEVVLTERYIERLQYEGSPTRTAKGNISYPRNAVKDAVVRGLRVEIYPTGGKSYLVKNPKEKRYVVIGKTNAITLEEARTIATEWRYQFRLGRDPAKERRDARRAWWERKHAHRADGRRKAAEPILRVDDLMPPAVVKRTKDKAVPTFTPIPSITKAFAEITLMEVARDFFVLRKIKKGTMDHYARMMNTYLRDWLEQPVVNIGRDEVQMRHHQISYQNGPAAANSTMRMLSSIMTYAAYRYRSATNEPIVRENPVMVLSQLRSWNKSEPKRRMIKKEDLRRWYQAVTAINSPNTPDYLLLIMFTGLRKGEAGGLLWEDVSLYERTFVIRDTKNSKDHLLPMCSFVFDLLSRRKATATTPWVFPNRKNDGRMSTESTGPYERIARDTGIAFSPHDLRRNYVSMAVAVKTDHYQLKQLINHAGGGDVTFRHYIIRDVDALREPAEKICRAFEYFMGIDEQPLRVTIIESAEDAEVVERLTCV